MSEAIRNLALGVQYLSDETLRFEANEKAKQVLKAFFVDEETKMLPQVEYAQVHPEKVGAKGNASFFFSVSYT